MIEKTQLLKKSAYTEIRIDQENALLLARWLPETLHMSEKEYKNILLQLADYTSMYQLKKWLGNTQLFAFTIPPALQTWTASEFNPLLISTHLEKIALVMPEDIFSELAIQQTLEEMEEMEKSSQKEKLLETKYFDTEERAVSWLHYK